MTLREYIAEIKVRLGVKYDLREVDWMVRDIFDAVKGYSPVDIVLHGDEMLSDFVQSEVGKIVDRLLDDEPLQYILGYAHFCGHRFGVNRATLIPRPETQELVDKIVRENNRSDLRVLDVGTGSGCIAISLARALRFPIVDAIDISSEALDVARMNARDLKVKVNFIQDDALSMSAESGTYDIIVSNPPYIIESEKREMERNVLDYEPSKALFVPDSDPLRFYRAIAVYASEALAGGGMLYFEINPLFVDEMTRLLENNSFENVDIIKDMQGRDRFATARKPL